METDRLRYFCAVVDTGSLTKASEVLGISHSGLSKAMSVLQDELGYKVLSPRGRGLELTERGKDLYERSRKIIEMVGALKSASIRMETPLKIGFPEVLALAVSEPLMKELGNTMTIEDLDSGEIEARILDRQADFAFTFVPFPHKDLDHLKIATISISSFCLFGSFQGEDPENIPYVIPSSELKDNPLSIKIRDGWKANLLRLTPYRTNSVSIALKMAQSGLCAIYTPDFLIACLNEFEPKNRQLVALEQTSHRKLQERTQRDVFLVKRNCDDESKEMKKVIKVVRQICKKA